MLNLTLTTLDTLPYASITLGVVKSFLGMSAFYLSDGEDAELHV
jgi:hypothetical protein